MTQRVLRKALKAQADPERAKVLQGFFKTGPGHYGEGEVFLGITVPAIRKIAKRFQGMSLREISKSLESSYHEERFAALLLLVHLFEKGDEKLRKKVFDFYLKHTDRINNWDLVDLSADKIVGVWLEGRSRVILRKLAKSKSLWERRIAMVATFHFIKNGESTDALRIAKILLKDEHDLIHKAAGWMLREVGKRCSIKEEESFLRRHYRAMPRTMLRYAIERFPEPKRRAYLKGRV